MALLLIITRIVFFISVGLYIYFFSRRKSHDVAIQMWLTIAVGMLAGLLSAIIDVNLGNYTLSAVQISLALYSAAIIYSLWKLSLELKKRRH